MNENFSQIIGYESIKAELIQISDALANSEPYAKLGVKSPTGLLLYGDPGVGKTLMASAVIKSSGRKHFICRKDTSGGDFVKQIKTTFEQAILHSPSIVLLDDMDKFANGDQDHPDAEEYVTVQACIDQVHSQGNDVFVLATVNNMRVLPKSLTRAGRFDRVIYIDNPSGEDAVKIIQHYIDKKSFVDDVDVVSIARVMGSCSCAELETVINEAGLYTGFERRDRITLDDFMKAYLHTMHDVPFGMLTSDFTLQTDLNDFSDLITRIVYHEAGHATVAESLVPGSVSLVSAYSGEYNNGGFTCYDYGNKRTGFLEIEYARACGALGGRAALEQKFGYIDIGTCGDLDEAFHEVYHLIADACVSGFEFHRDGYHQDSDATAAKREQAVTAEVNRLYAKAKEFIAINHDFFEAVAAALLKKGVLATADITQLRKDHPVTQCSL